MVENRTIFGSDVNLVKIVHRELVNGYEVSAMITRFGELAVFVYAKYPVEDLIAQTDNILKARDIANKQSWGGYHNLKGLSG